MNNFVIGTAGHIDHGKTSLIKAMTGINTDTLKEEQKRGITIDLGFSYLKISDDLTAGIVDVPGHEKLIKNMLSGVCGIDMVLLVIAADDGIMPQTKEHFDIIRFLNIKNTLVVLTKTDLVSKERVIEVRNEIKEQFKLEKFVEFSIYDDKSTIDVIEAIKSEIEGFKNSSLPSEYFRMPVDRVFNVKGHGVVITGSSISGEVKIGDKLEILPSKEVVKVKGIQVFKQNKEIAYKKTRIALNLGGIKKEDIERGKLIATPNKVKPSKIIDVKITVSDNDITIKHLETVKFYYLANEVKARVKLFNLKSISKNDIVYGQLLLYEELYAVNNDLGVLRKLNNITVAGVEIVNVKGKFANRKSEVYENRIKNFELGDKKSLVNEYIINNDFCHINNIKDDLDLIESRISDFSLDVYQIDNYYLSNSGLANFKQSVLKIVSDFHDNNKNEIGINKNELQNILKIEIPNRTFSKFLKLIDEIEVTDKVKLKSHTISLSKEEQLIADRIISFINSGEFKPPKFNEIFSEVKGKYVDDVYFTLIKSGILIKIDDDITLTKELYNKMIDRFSNFFKQNMILSLTEARELLNTSRRYVVPYLEYLDKIGYTRRVENGRIKK